MKTLYLKAEDPGTVETAAKLLREGQLVAIPTETVYGLGANAMDEEAEMVLITENVLEKDFRKAVDALREMPILKEISAIIRVYSA